jgi:hypothetical protein
MAAKDRAHLTLLDSMMEPEHREQLFTALRPLAEDPGLASRVQELYERLDDLADAEVDDPRIGPLGDALTASMPDELIQLMGDGVRQAESSFGEAFLADFAPAQAAVVRRMLAGLAARARGLQ